MKPTWVVVASSVRARFFFAEPKSLLLHEIEDFVNPQGRLHDREITEDLPGKNRSAAGGAGHAYQQSTDPKKHAAQYFAHSVAHYLESALEVDKFEQLLIIAEPSFLGLLREELPVQVKKLVCFELNKNLTEQEASEIRKHIPKYL